MRFPVKSETDAFRLSYGLAALIGLALLLGYLTDPLAGVGLFAGGVAGAFYWDLVATDPDRRRPLREALGEAPQDDRKRILVVANETLGGEELRAEILRRGEPRPELHVVAPVLASRTHYVASDIDAELEQARKRLDTTLSWARAQGFQAAGEVGGDGPLAAIEDALRRFGADELIVSTHPPERSNWLESGVVERARAELDIPVTHVIVDLDRQHVEIA